MPDNPTETQSGANPPQDPTAGDGGQGAAGRSLADLLAEMPEDQRAIVLGEVDKARREAAGLRQRNKELAPKAAEYERLAEASKTELERAQEARANAERQASAAQQRIVSAEVRALAASDFADPADAVSFLGDLSQFVNDDGEVDDKAVRGALADLLKRKPYLGKAQEPTGPVGPRPDRTQGRQSRGTDPDDVRAAVGRQLFSRSS